LLSFYHFVVCSLALVAMSTISTALRNFKEPTKDQLTQIFFSLPSLGSLDGTEKSSSQEVEKMDINAVLSLGVQGEEDSYVSVDQTDER